jgi:hypothetical protein
VGGVEIAGFHGVMLGASWGSLESATE